MPQIHSAIGCFNLTLEILVFDRDYIRMREKLYGKACFNLTLEILVFDREQASSTWNASGEFQSHS